jgi:hypothetical protein
MIRQDEQAALRNLPPPPAGTTIARTVVPISRELYAQIERPPTRHREFYIITHWRAPEMAPESHGVFVKASGGKYRYRPVVEDRPGLFGEAT